MKNRLTDSQGRKINYLRISVTDRCNLKCTYCAPTAQRKFIPHPEILSYEEILKIAKIMSKNGLEKVRLTGGEPLMRKDLDLLVREINKIDGIKEVTLTTNAILLFENAEKLKKAGIKRLNISLDTLNPETFEKITGKPLLHKVLGGIKAAKEAGIKPIKINTVILDKINNSDIEDLVSFSLKNDYHLRFIELMPVGSLSFYKNHRLSSDNVKKIIEQKFGSLLKTDSDRLSGPASMHKIKGSKGQVGFIHAMTNHFCNECNRVRLTSDGRIRPCLLEDKFYDLKKIIRSGGDDKEILEMINFALSNKASTHKIIPQVKTKMFSIGG